MTLPSQPGGLSFTLTFKSTLIHCIHVILLLFKLSPELHEGGGHLGLTHQHVPRL